MARTALLTRAALLGAGAALALTAVSNGADRRVTLRSQVGHLRDAESRALLELFAADAALARSRDAVTRLTREAHAQQLGVDESQRLLRLSETNVRRARTVLAERLRASYRTGPIDGLAVVLSASSLADVLDRASIVQRVTEQDATTVAAVTSALRSATTATRNLTRARRRLARALAAARDTSRRLDQARAAKAALLHELRRSVHLAGARIAALDAAAAAAEEKGSHLGGGTRPPPGGGGTTGGGPSGTFRVTAYSDHGTTATGIQTRPGVCATDPRVIPMGTRFTVPGYGECVAADTGGDIKGNWVDVWFNTDAEANSWGSQHLTLSF